METDSQTCSTCGRADDDVGGLRPTYDGAVCDSCYQWMMQLTMPSIEGE